jgi:uncharacterized membrane protein YjgN (DUF898 family)
MTSPDPERHQRSDELGGALRARLRHHGEVYDLFGIHMVNMALTIVTIGVYRFWAKTGIRRYLWSQTSFLDDRFEYTGTGKELLVGFAIVMAILFGFFTVYTGLFTWIWPDWAADEGLQTLYNAPVFILSVVVVGMARFRARRYRLSRTLWRGIRGAQTGSSVQFGLLELGFWMLTLLTLGFYWPYKSTRLAAYQYNNTWFGDRRMEFEATGDKLLGVFALCWLLTLPTLGLSLFWYRAAATRYFASRVRYGDLGFKADIDGWSLALLVIPNWLLTTFTLGLARPYVLIRTTKFICDRLVLIGDQDFALIAQNLRPRPTSGEGLAEAFDVGDF